MRYYDHPGMIHPGIKTHDPSRNRKQYYVFYQWVCFVLFLQGVSFFLPRFIWRTFVVSSDWSILYLRVSYWSGGRQDEVPDLRNEGAHHG